MKKVTRCLNCGNVVRVYGSFSVMLDDSYQIPLTGEWKQRITYGKLDRKCAKLAGYKVKGVDDNGSN